MKQLIWFCLLVLMTMGGWAEDNKNEPYSAELVKKAEAGDAKAQHNLGACYCEGKTRGETGSEQEIYWSRACAFGILVRMCGVRDSLERNALFKQGKKVSR